MEHMYVRVCKKLASGPEICVNKTQTYTVSVHYTVVTIHPLLPVTENQVMAQ